MSKQESLMAFSVLHGGAMLRERNITNECMTICLDIIAWR